VIVHLPALIRTLIWSLGLTPIIAVSYGDSNPNPVPVCRFWNKVLGFGTYMHLDPFAPVSISGS